MLGTERVQNACVWDGRELLSRPALTSALAVTLRAECDGGRLREERESQPGSSGRTRL